MGDQGLLFDPPHREFDHEVAGFDLPERRELRVPASEVVMRDYQDRAVKAVMADFRGTAKSTLVVMPTGTGKTMVIGGVFKETMGWGRCLLLAHREELIFQGAEKAAWVTGEAPEIEMAEYRTDERQAPGDKARIVVGTVQTLSRGRMERFDPTEFSCICIDEAHHATANSYRKVLDYFQHPGLRTFGVTATPDRSDEEALGQIFESVAIDYEVPDAIADGWLVPIRQRFVDVQGLDYSSVRTKAGDLHPSDLRKILDAEENLHGIASPVIDLVGDRRTLVFAISVEQAERLTEIFNRHKAGCAGFVCGKTPKDERRDILNRYDAGELQFLCNVGIATEGYDSPGVEVVAMARPTKSRSLYAQMAGRSTRPLPGVVDGLGSAPERRASIEQSAKPCCEIIDFVGNSGRHRLVTSADILGGNYTLDEIDLANEIAKKATNGCGKDVGEALDEARTEMQDRVKRDKRLAAQQRANVLAEALYTTTEAINVFDVLGVEPQRGRGWNRGRRPTEKMVGVLERAGIVGDKRGQIPERDLSFDAASQLIQGTIDRRQADKCSYKQAKVLARFNYSTDCTFAEASETIDALAKNGWRRPK
jgi:superfamily II DNA or RNA helicase